MLAGWLYFHISLYQWGTITLQSNKKELLQQGVENTRWQPRKKLYCFSADSTYIVFKNSGNLLFS